MNTKVYEKKVFKNCCINLDGNNVLLQHQKN